MSNTVRKILVVDDDPVVAKSFDRVLASKGYAVITAGSGEEALAKMAEEKYDAVFADIRMPGMSGIEVAQQVKASQPWMPVVIITGYGSPANEVDAAAAGVTDFLRKPLSPEMIEQSADKAVHMNDATETVVAEVQPVVEKQMSKAKAIGLFLLAPFFGLAYIIAMPLVFGAIFGSMAFKAAYKNDKIRSGMMMVAGPVIALAAIIAAPIAGLGALAYFGYKAATKKA